MSRVNSIFEARAPGPKSPTRLHFLRMTRPEAARARGVHRGQIFSQVFVLLLASIIFILILVYGYKAISQFTQRSEQIGLIDFENDLKNGVKSISLDFGSVKRVDLTLPPRHRQVCVFCSPDQLGTCDPSPQFQEDHPLLVESWQSGSQNVFLVPLSDTPVLVERVEAQDGGFCTAVIDGKVSLRLEGKGDHALVGPWQ